MIRVVMMAKKMYVYPELVRMETSNAGEQLVKCQNQVCTENKAGILRNAAFQSLFLGKKKL
jgi:hypothetical protein